MKDLKQLLEDATQIMVNGKVLFNFDPCEKITNLGELLHAGRKSTRYYEKPAARLSEHMAIYIDKIDLPKLLAVVDAARDLSSWGLEDRDKKFRGYCASYHALEEALKELDE